MRDLTAAMSQIIAANVKTLRTSLRLNQTEFGEILDVSQGTVARWENGSEPKNDRLVKMAELARCGVADFTSRLLSKLEEEGEERTSPSSPAIFLPVFLPSEGALTQMFDGLLGLLAAEKDQAVIARRLAQLLPSALAQTVSRMRFQQTDADDAIARLEGAQPREQTTESTRP